MHRYVVAAAALMSLAACQDPATAPKAVDAESTPESTAASSPAPTSAAERALTEVWQSANPGVTPPGLAAMTAAFDPAFEQIARAEPDDARAFVAATSALVAALAPIAPAICVELPLARFTPQILAQVPDTALPAFRAMLTSRLATIKAGKARTDAILPAFSGSMQNFSLALTDDAGTAMDTLAPVALGRTYDPVAACAATVKGWKALETTPQAPLMIDMLYSTGDYAG